MSHELTPNPKYIYDEYIRAEERLGVMKQAQRELPDLDLEDVHDMARWRRLAVEKETKRFNSVLEQATEYSAKNLIELKKQAAHEAKAAGKVINLTNDIP